MNFNLKEINKKTATIIVGGVVLVSALGAGSYFALHKSKPKQDDPFTLNLPAPKAPEVKPAETTKPVETAPASTPSAQPVPTSAAPGPSAVAPTPAHTVEAPKVKEEVKATPEPQPVKEAPKAAPEQPKHKVKKVRVETRSESAPAVHPAQPVAPQPAPAKAWYQ